MTTVLDFGDLHLFARTRENVTHAMGQILDLARDVRPDAIVNGGDLSHSSSTLEPWIARDLREFHVALAEIAPVLVVAGNHDLTPEQDKAGVLAGVLYRSARESRISLYEAPGIWHGRGGLEIACLPYPNKWALAAWRPDLMPSELNAKGSEYLEDIARSLAAQMSGPGLLAFHGSINGAKTGTEQSMEVGVDFVLRESAIPDVFRAVLCGHIHKPQTIGRAVYCGSPCPLDHGEENHEHGAVIWESPDNGDTWAHRFVAFEPKHRLLTVDVRNSERVSDITGAKVRVLARIPRGQDATAYTEGVRRTFLSAGAHEVKVVIEREAEDCAGQPANAGVRADASLSALIPLYCERNPDARDLCDKLIEFGMTEIEPALPAEARDILRGGDWRLIALEMVNFKSFGKVERLEVDSLGRLVSVDGPNHNGKSNLLESIGYALWGRTPREPASTASYVRNGTDEMLVGAEIEADGQTWRIRRGVHLNGNGKPKGSLMLDREQVWKGAWEPASNGNSRETQAKVERLVGSWDLYLATRFASQGDIARLLNFTPGELKDALQSALGAGVFVHRDRLARERAGAAEREAARFASQVDVLEPRAAELEAAREAVERIGLDLVEKMEGSDIASERYSERAVALDHARDDVREAEAEEARRAATRERLQRIQAEASGLLTRRVDLSESILLAETHRALLESHETDRAELARRSLLREQAIAHEKDVADANARLESEKANQDAAVERIAKEVREAGLRHTQAVQRLELRRREIPQENERRKNERAALWASLNFRLLEARDASLLIGEVPFKEKCAEAKCKLLASAIGARERVPQLEAELSALTQQHADAEVADRCAGVEEILGLELVLAGANEAHEDLAAELADATARRAERIAALEAALKAACRRLDTFDHAAWSDLQEKVAEFDADGCRARIAAADQAAGEINGIDRQLDALKAEASEVEAELGPEPENTLAALRSEAEEAERALADARAALDTLRAEEASLREQRAAAEATVKAREADAAALADAKTQLTAAQESANVARIFARAMGKDGIPFLMLERAIPALEHATNEFLGDEDLRVEIEPMRDLASGEQRSEVHIRYRDGLGLQDLALASGEQQVKLGLALRFALARVQAEAHGITPSLVLCDEGLAALDSDQKISGQRILARVAAWAGRVLFVSHDEEVRAAADTLIRVQIKDGVSVVEVSA